MDRCADYVLDSGHRGQVDDRNHLARNVGETEAGGMQHRGWTSQFVGAEDCKESFDRRTTFRRAQIPARGLAAVRFDNERVACVVETRAQPS